MREQIGQGVVDILSSGIKGSDLLIKNGSDTLISMPANSTMIN